MIMKSNVKWFGHEKHNNGDWVKHCIVTELHRTTQRKHLMKSYGMVSRFKLTLVHLKNGS